MLESIKDKAAIVGIGMTEISKNSGRSELQLAAECVKAAIDDAGLKPSDIDGITGFTLDHVDDIEVARTVGLGELKMLSRMPHGGGASMSLVHQAAMAVATGVCKAVVGYRAMNGRSGARYSSGVAEGPETTDRISWGWYMPYGLLTPACWVAMHTRAYMDKYGASDEGLAEIAVTQRKFAANNPRALFYGKPITYEDYYSAPWIVEPLRLYDCCVETDGGAAFVVTSTERAKDLRHPPAVIRAAAQGSAFDQEVMTSFYREDITRLPEYELVAEQLYAQSGLGPDDIDAAIIYDAFTSIVWLQLEVFRFCKPGEAHEWVKGGTLDLDGRLPTNTHGGLLSEGYVHGINGLAEAVRIIRGTAINQPKKNDHVLVTSGASMPTSAAILGKLA
ncbi:MAG: lipid-transfer protein [Candidatus Dadabacteria bacterium]|nr:MAG: lipid-transfer protein [Candidatus Dadabacteria bacterium]